MVQQPSEGQWSIRNVISHLRDAQVVMDFRVNLLLDKENPKIESQAVFEWATREQEHPPSTHDLLNTYRSLREDTITMLEAIPLKDWWRAGRHEEFGDVTIQQQASYFACHEITHLPQIETLRNELLSVA